MIQPLLEEVWDTSNADHEPYFIAVYAFYAIWCLAVYIYLIAPWLGLPSIDIGSLTSEYHSAVGFLSILVASLSMIKRSATKRVATAKKILEN